MMYSTVHCSQITFTSHLQSKISNLVKKYPKTGMKRPELSFESTNHESILQVRKFDERLLSQQAYRIKQ